MSNLAKALKNKNTMLNRFIPKGISNYMSRATDILVNEGYEKNPKRVGDKLPSGKFLNFDGQMVDLDLSLSNRPAIISFYRGAWCPYCNLELSFYDEILGELDNNNVLMFAISPEKPDVTMKKIDIQSLNYTVLSDVDNQFAKKMKLVFQLPKKLKLIYRLFGINLKRTQGSDEGELPLPATYIIDNNKMITHAWIDADYTKRAEPEDVISAYKSVLNR